MKKQYMKPTVLGIYPVIEEVMQQLSGWQSDDGNDGGGVFPPSGGGSGSDGPNIGGTDSGSDDWGGGW